MSKKAESDNLIENLFASEPPEASTSQVKMVKKKINASSTGSKEVALAPKKRLTKKQKKVMQ